jgi:hypothetical protein
VDDAAEEEQQMIPLHGERDLPIYAWKPRGTVHLLGRCDICGRRPLLARHHEVYWRYLFADGGEGGWLWVCTRCLADELGDIAEVGLRALTKIKEEEGHVCPDFELCTHEACRSSYSAWAVADAALQGRLLAPNTTTPGDCLSADGC